MMPPLGTARPRPGAGPEGAANGVTPPCCPTRHAAPARGSSALTGRAGTATLSPSGNGTELAGPRLPRAGQLVPLTLVPGQAGRVTIEATVTPPGTP
jgi:hypothetical protein